MSCVVFFAGVVRDDHIGIKLEPKTWCCVNLLLNFLIFFGFLLNGDFVESFHVASRWINEFLCSLGDGFVIISWILFLQIMSGWIAMLVISLLLSSIIWLLTTNLSKRNCVLRFPLFGGEILQFTNSRVNVLHLNSRCVLVAGTCQEEGNYD